MKARVTLTALLLLGGLAFQSAPALADTRDLIDHIQRQKQEQRDQDRGPSQDERQQRREERREQRRENPRIDAGEAARRAQMRNGGGRVLDVNPMDQGYRVKLLKQGEVRTLLVPDGFDEAP